MEKNKRLVEASLWERLTEGETGSCSDVRGQIYKSAIKIAEERREAKGKGEKERYTYLNAELQRIAMRDKEAFLSDQCKEKEENN